MEQSDKLTAEDSEAQVEEWDQSLTLEFDSFVNPH